MQSALQFIPKVFSKAEFRTLCRTLEFFHTNLGKPLLYGPHFVNMGIVMLRTGLGLLVPMNGNGNTTAYRNILYNCVFPLLRQQCEDLGDNQVSTHSWPYSVNAITVVAPAITF